MYAGEWRKRGLSHAGVLLRQVGRINANRVVGMVDVVAMVAECTVMDSVKLYGVVSAWIVNQDEDLIL
jgi:hypothetical protein